MTSTDVVLFDGKFVRADEPIVSSNSRGLMYGDGVFETFRAYNGQTLFLKEHLRRLQSGLDFLGMDSPENISSESFQLLVFRLLDRLDLLGSDAIVRLQLWREGQRGYLPDQRSKTHFMISTSPCPKTFENPRLATVESKRIPDQSLPSKYKLSNGINYILAARQADRQGADDALMETIDGFLSETTIANIFWASGNEVFTPSENCDLLPGITRQILIDLINKNPRWKLSLGNFEREALREAEVVWICNSVREMLTVRSIDQVEYPIEHPLFSELETMFEQFKKDHLQPLNSAQ